MSNPMTTRVANRVLLAMAYNRETFKDKVEEHIGGALLEYYKARLATKNNKTDWVNHWLKEVDTLLNRNLVTALVHEIKGFKDREKAFNEVVTALKIKDDSYRRIAGNIIKRDFKLRKLSVPLEDSDTETFWKMVDEVVTLTGLGAQNKE